MDQQWRIGVSGKQRKEIDVDLLIQAVIALGNQLREEEQERARFTEPANQEPLKEEKGA